MSATQSSNSGLTALEIELVQGIMKQVPQVNIKKLAEDMKITANAAGKRW